MMSNSTDEVSQSENERRDWHPLHIIKAWPASSMLFLICLVMLIAVILVPRMRNTDPGEANAVTMETTKPTPGKPRVNPPKLLATTPPDTDARPALVEQPSPKPVAPASVEAPSAPIAAPQQPRAVVPSRTKPAPQRKAPPAVSPSAAAALAYRHAQGPVVPLKGEALRRALVADAIITQAANERQLASSKPE